MDKPSYSCFGKQLEAVWRRCRSYFRRDQWVAYEVAINESEQHSLCEERPISFINAHCPWLLADGGRYFYALINELNNLGHQVLIPKRLWLFSEMRKKRYTRDLWEKRFIYLRDWEDLDQERRKCSYYWSDREVSRGRMAKKKIQLSFSKGRAPAPWHWIPYPLYPRTPVEEFSSSENSGARPIAVLFSGSVRKDYQTKEVASFGLMNRHKLYHHLVSSDLPITYYEKLMLSGKPFKPDSLYLPIYDSAAQKSCGQIPPADYLELLSHAAFMVCPPGRTMPFSHSVTEGMMAGCIPIIEYGKHFDPKLEDEINCFMYESDNGENSNLIEVIKKAILTGEHEIAKMREQVKKYYRQHLTFSSFFKKIEDAPQQVVKAYYND